MNGNPVDWTSIRIEKEVARELDELHIERMESYNDIVKRLIRFFKENEGKEPPKKDDKKVVAVDLQALHKKQHF